MNREGDKNNIGYPEIFAGVFLICSAIIASLIVSIAADDSEVRKLRNDLRQCWSEKLNG